MSIPPSAKTQSFLTTVKFQEISKVVVKEALKAYRAQGLLNQIVRVGFLANPTKDLSSYQAIRGRLNATSSTLQLRSVSGQL